jgi:putative SbcD/Mre11-related phosphoesterase
LLKVVPGEAALIFKDGEDSTILVSDLHLGLEKEMAAKGFRIPPYSMKIMDRINSVAEKYSANRIVVLGDVKHSIGKVEDIDWNVLPWFFDTLLDVFGSVEVVPGNHDGGIKTLLPSRVKLHPSSGAVLGSGEKVGVTHGHSWPSQEVILCGRVVIGHSHFRYEMRDRFGSRTKEAVWLFAPYDKAELLRRAGSPQIEKGEGELIVMPPFNNLVGGQAINAKGGFDFGPVLSSGAVDVKDADVFLLDGTRV